MTEIKKALEFGAKAHRGQERKYTGEPYFNHPIEVAHLVMGVTTDINIVAAALLHDVVEDTNYTLEDLSKEFNEEIVQLVKELTYVTTKADGNRATRMVINREHTANSCPKAKTIKLADLINNTKSIVKHDPKFAKVYMAEKRKLLEVLKEGDELLYSIAYNIVEDYYNE